jgi:hypothetical protein
MPPDVVPPPPLVEHMVGQVELEVVAVDMPPRARRPEDAKKKEKDFKFGKNVSLCIINLWIVFTRITHHV